MKHEFAILSLWLIAFSATAVIVHEPRVFTYIAPLFAVCMIGSVVTVRAARRPAA